MTHRVDAVSSVSVPCLTASNATLAGSPPSGPRTIRAPTRDAQVSSWSAAAARNVSAAPSSTVRPSATSSRAILPQVVVLPVPLTPTTSRTAGCPSACGTVCSVRSMSGCRAVTSSSASSARSSPSERVPSTLVRVRSRSTISWVGADADVRGQQRVLDLLPGVLVQVLPGQQRRAGRGRGWTGTGPAGSAAAPCRPAAASGTSSPGPVVSTRVPSPGPGSGSVSGLTSGSVSTAVPAASASARSGGTAFSGAGGSVVPRRRGTTTRPPRREHDDDDHREDHLLHPPSLPACLDRTGPPRPTGTASRRAAGRRRSSGPPPSAGLVGGGRSSTHQCRRATPGGYGGRPRGDQACRTWAGRRGLGMRSSVVTSGQSSSTASAT